MNKQKKYVGIHNDVEGGMTPIGKIIRDAWVFGLIPETQTCEGWNAGQVQTLYDSVDAEWSKYGHLPSNLPDDLKAKHTEIYKLATKQARAKGWNPDQSIQDDR